MNPTVQFEWLFETINKRIGQGFKLEDLFLCVPHKDEAEFEYELLHIFKTASRKIGVTMGNALSLDYPHLAKLAANSNHTLKLCVFLIKPERLQNVVLLHTKKYKYPKINLSRSDKAFDLSSTDTTKAIVEDAVRKHYLRSKEASIN